MSSASSSSDIPFKRLKVDGIGLKDPPMEPFDDGRGAGSRSARFSTDSVLSPPPPPPILQDEPWFSNDHRRDGSRARTAGNSVEIEGGDSGFSDSAGTAVSCDDNSQEAFNHLPSEESSSLERAPLPNHGMNSNGDGVPVDDGFASGSILRDPDLVPLDPDTVDMHLLASSDQHPDGEAPKSAESGTTSRPAHDDGPREGGRADTKDQDDDVDDDDDDDNVSSISGISDLSGADWKPSAGPFSWVQHQMMRGADPRILLKDMISADSVIPDHLDQLTLWKIILNMVSEPPKRRKLENHNTFEDAVQLIRSSRKIVVLTGAGVSVSCGIPDFRSRDGVYARLAVDFPDLPDPQAMFDINYFRKDPRPFFKFAKEIYPGQFNPSPCHRFIKCLEKHGKLLRNYTQNIDTLEQVVGINNVVQCHGSFATASCTRCRFKVDADQIKEDIFHQRIPYCTRCSDLIRQRLSSGGGEEAAAAAPPTSVDEDRGIMKPDIVFFGEGLGDEFHRSVAKDKHEVDLLIMIGSSLKVRPVALIPSSVHASIPQILINREPLSHLTPDVELLGDCDGIINQICLSLGEGWSEPVHKEALGETLELLPASGTAPQQQNGGADQGCGGGQSGEEGHGTTMAAQLWEPQKSLAERLPPGCYQFRPPSRYVFPGAEVFETEGELDEDSNEESSCNSDEDDDDQDGNDSDDERSSVENQPLDNKANNSTLQAPFQKLDTTAESSSSSSPEPSEASSSTPVKI